MRRALAAALFLALAVPAAAAAPVKVTPKGAGKVKLGKTHASLEEAGLVGRLRKGCELGGPGTRAARLRAPLAGAVELTRKDPRRIRSVLVTKGGEARGVGIGDARADIEEAYPKATFNTSTEDVFGITLVKVPKGGGGKLQFGIDAETKKITLIGVPRIPFCE